MAASAHSVNITKSVFKKCVGATIRKHPHWAAERYPGAVSETPKSLCAPYETPKAWIG